MLLDMNWVDLNDPAAKALQCAAGESLADVRGWVGRWATERYGGGAGEAEAQQAWGLLAATVYSAEQGRGTDAQDQADALTSCERPLAAHLPVH